MWHEYRAGLALMCGKAVVMALLLAIVGLCLLPWILFASGDSNDSLPGVAVTSYVVAAALARLLWWMAVRIQEHFIHGCANPAVVVSMTPPLVAVSGDLTLRRGDHWPVVKIIAQPLDRVRGPRPKVGDRLATVALYYGFYNKPHWDNFFPIVANCVTDDEETLRELMSRLDSEEGAWEELEAHLKQVPTPYRPGLYWIRPPTRPGLL